MQETEWMGAWLDYVVLGSKPCPNFDLSNNELLYPFSCHDFTDERKFENGMQVITNDEPVWDTACLRLQLDTSSSWSICLGRSN